MWTRRVPRAIAIPLVTLPLYIDWVRARLTRWAAEATRGASRKVGLTVLGGALVVLLSLTWHPLAALLLAPLALGPALARFAAWARRKLDLQVIARGNPSTEGLAPARQTLLGLGLDDATTDRIIALARNGEVRLATFDQENRVLSAIGPIPFFREVQIEAEQFRTRNRHLLELVITRDVVCVKKVYRDPLSFEIELLALHALRGITGVPRIVAVQLHPRIIYQSFIAGTNLGSMMASHGASDRVQDEVSVEYWGGGRSGATAVAVARTAALAALEASVPPDTVTKLHRLMDRIHQSGVTITDVKYGNVLMVGGEPHFCDFDRAAVYRRNNWRCVKHRANDRTMFNYFFGADALTERTFRAAEAGLRAERPQLFTDRMYYGQGYAGAGDGSLSRGSGFWRYLRPHLPELAGKRILDLGGHSGIFALEMLRAGAQRVTLCEPDPVVARLARLSHRWLEFVDNRHYEFEVLDGQALDVVDSNRAGFDIATAFRGLPPGKPEEVAHRVRGLSRGIACLVLRASDAVGEEQTLSTGQLRALLATNGYADQAIVESTRDRQPVLIGRRA